jgi:CubicO group peptidase (beta-lactamase class C family)
MKKVAALLVLSHVTMLPAMAAAQSYVPELGPSPPQDAMQLYPGGVEKAVAALPDVVKKVKEASNVPGFAVAVVHDGKMIFDEGYGLRDNRDDTSKVSSTTIFQVASVSKSISATVAAIAMTKNHSFDWDTPVGKVWDGFHLSLDYVSGNATIGDFFAHRSGLPMAAGDELEDLGFQRKQILGSLWMVPLDPFRISYHYANFGTTIGAEAVAHADKQTWELLAKSMLFEPLGMRSSSYLHKDFIAAGDNRALLHTRVADNVFEPLYDRDPDQQAPAGGVSSNAQDLAKWMILLLADGTNNGLPMIDPKILQPAITPQIVTNRGKTPDTRVSSYGYGFNIGVNANGRTTMGHSGAFLLGAGTTFQLLPSADVGIVVLTNGAPVGAAEAVAASFMDIVQYGKVTRDWYPYIKPQFMGFYKPVGDLAGKDKPTNPTKARGPSFYAGQYTNRYFGTATVLADGEKLVLELGPKPMQFTLEHWDGDTYALSPRGENAPTGSLSSVKFGGSPGDRARVMTVDYLNENGLGHFQR